MNQPGLLKEAPMPIATLDTTQTQVIAPQAPPSALTAPSWEGVPTDIIRYFVGEDFGAMGQKTTELLRDINDWSKQNLAEDTIGNRLQKIKSLEMRLGAPAFHQSRIDKLWNFVRMDRAINEIRLRQQALER